MSESSGGGGEITLKVSPDPGMTLNFSGMTLTEELGRPFDAQLDITSDTRSGDLSKLLGCTATVTIRNSDGSKRYFNGVIVRAIYSGMAAGAYRYRLELRPSIWLLSRRRDCQIFQNKSAWDIITGVLRTEGLTDFQDKRQSQSGDIQLEYCVQFEETLLDFVTRLMEKYGIYYYTTHQDGRHIITFADDPNSHTSVGKAIPYRFQQGDVRQLEDYVWEWSADLLLQPGKVALRDYNFETPAADLTTQSLQPASHPHGDAEMYDYPGPYGNTGDGQKLATVRMQSLAAQREIVRGTTNARGVTAGSKFTLSENPDTSQNREYLVIATTTSFALQEGRAASRGDTRLDQYVSSVTAIPGDTPFRLPQITPWPRMRGPQTAKVAGEAGQEITTDKYARIKVKFPWDRTAVQDENASCWIRVSQPWAGTGFGAMVIPRIGQEVVVDFLDGSPDRPIVTGCVYNASNTNADAMPGNKTRSGFRTNSSPGGGGYNELRFEDKKGEEEVYLQAQYDFNVKVLNNHTTKVTKDRTTTIEQGNESLTVSQGNRSVTVSQGNDSHTVSTGNHTLSIDAGSSTISAAQSITLKVGGNSIVIDTSGVTINGTKIGLTASASMSANGGTSMTLQAAAISIN
ncbi:MAG: type VI secretion system tip protein VgrG [Proteobacteria bacterium]|nr:type VI secretion system tip protein VgrG [Pseudomonadota bacterium]